MPTTKINIGPVHPSTHGVLHFVVSLDGDEIVEVEPHIGFLHRGVEKLCENRMYMQNHVYMEKLDYVAPLAYDELYVATVEDAMGIEVKERAQYIRVIELELQRIASHLLWLGTMCNDLGQMFTTFELSFKDRDIVLRLLEQATGSRMFYVNMRLGGVKQDFPAGFEGKVLDAMTYLERRVGDYERYLEKNPVFMSRMKGVGKMSKAEATELGVSGPVLRASGIRYDVRSASPYYLYDKLNFTPQVLLGGDNYARYRLRMMELYESIRLVRSAAGKMPEGDALGMPVKLVSPPVKKAESMVKREMPRGEGMMYMVSEKQGPYRLSIRSPVFINLAAINRLAKGSRLADFFAILGSLDLVVADADR